MSIDLMAELHRATRSEFALIRLSDGRRVLIRGLGDKVDVQLPLVDRLIAHTHPSGKLTPSMNPDVYNMWVKNKFPQNSSLIITENGQIQRFFKSDYKELIEFWLRRGD